MEYLDSELRLDFDALVLSRFEGPSKCNRCMQSIAILAAIKSGYILGDPRNASRVAHLPRQARVSSKFVDARQ